MTLADITLDDKYTVDSGRVFLTGIQALVRVIKGSWRYLEHDWVATEGTYVFEPPGEIHTLIVDRDVEEMITFFNVAGCMYYVDDQGRSTGFEDVFTKIDMCQANYADVGLGTEYVKQFIR